MTRIFNIILSIIILQMTFVACNTNKPRQSDSAAATETVEELTSELHALKEQYRLNDSITLKFTVHNPTRQELRFTEYGTPFEKFLGKYLIIIDENGNEVDYSGPMARRVMPPPAETYHYLGADQSETVEFSIQDVYKFTKAGNYAIQYRGERINAIKSSNVISITIME